MDNSPKKALRLIFAGKPGCGKGTIGELITRDYGLVPISTGQLLRDEIEKGTPLGLEVKTLVETGQYVHEDYWLPLLKKRLEAEDCKTKGWIIDGAPRTKRHVPAFNAAGIIPDYFVVFDVSDETIVQRISGRRMDPVTKQIYHLKYHPPTDDEVAKRLIQRADDAEDKVKTRLKLYAENFADVDTWYPGNTVHVDATEGVDAVYVNTKKALNLH